MAKNNKRRSVGKRKPPSNNTTESRSSKKQMSTAAIETVKSIVNILKPYELSQTQRLRTYQAMMLDDAVGAAFSANSVLIEKAFSNYSVSFNENSETSKQAADFLSWNLANMNGQTVRSIARSAAEFKRDGLAPFEKMFRKGAGIWKDFWTIDKLSYIHPLTLDQKTPFTVVDGGRTVIEARQSTQALRNSSDMFSAAEVGKYPKGYIPIPRKKLAFMTYSATDAQPFGSSPFDSCYTAWREKVLLQDYTLVGVTKDFSGTPVLYLPESILAEASSDPSSASGIMVEQLKANMANMHTGDQNYTILPSDTLSENGSGAKAFEIKFLGVEGGGKAFNTTEIIEQRKKAIYNAFGAANLLAGDGSGGSYNLMEGQNTIHAHYVERDISVIEETWNTDIIPQLFRLNEWGLSLEDFPKIVAGDIEPVSLDEAGKFFNRVMRSLPAVPEVVNHLLELQKIPYKIPAGTSPKDIREMLFDFQEESKVGGGEGSSGTGGSQNGGQSDNNSENTA